MNDVTVTKNGNIDLPSIAAEHVGQSTAIEQSRAVAEVQAAMVCAKRFPRNESHAAAKIYASCERKGFAENAFYAFPRGGETISDVNIGFAREVARCWGNVQYEIVELSQDLQRGESECMSLAWDLESNARASIRFIVPHTRHTRNGIKKLTDPRDIYELIANNGARRLRQCILAVVPSDIIDAAKAICRRTMESKEDGITMKQRVSDCIKNFESIGVSRDMLSTHLGKLPEQMSVPDLTDLRIIFKSIKEGEPVSSFFSGGTGKIDTKKPEPEPKTEEPEAEKPKSTGGKKGGAKKKAEEKPEPEPEPKPEPKPEPEPEPEKDSEPAESDESPFELENTDENGADTESSDEEDWPE